MSSLRPTQGSGRSSPPSPPELPALVSHAGPRPYRRGDDEESCTGNGDRRHRARRNTRSPGRPGRVTVMSAPLNVQTERQLGTTTEQEGRRYLLFAGTHQPPNGGLGDLVNTFDSEDAARRAFREIRLRTSSTTDWAQLAVVDRVHGVKPLCWFGIGAEPERCRPAPDVPVGEASAISVRRHSVWNKVTRLITALVADRGGRPDARRRRRSRRHIRAARLAGTTQLDEERVRPATEARSHGTRSRREVGRPGGAVT
jgi:hypothetical protein